MGAAFTPEEQAIIKADLVSAGRKFLSKYGMRKTSIDQIVAEVGISKGAFYKFYKTKELLFFDVMEAIHEEVYIGVAKVFDETKNLPDVDRVEKALIYALQVFSESSFLTFMTDELPIMVRKIPPEKIKMHSADDALNISNLLKVYGIHLPYSPEFISSLVRALFSLLREKDNIGEAHSEEVIRFIIHSTCLSIFSNNP